MTRNLSSWIGINGGYIVFSLLIGIVSLLAAKIAGMLLANALLAFFIMALVISIATAWRYSQLRKLIGPVVVAALIMAGFAMVAAFTTLHEFNIPLSTGGGALGLAIIPTAMMMLFVYLILLLVPSLAIYAIITRIFGYFRRKPSL